MIKPFKIILPLIILLQVNLFAQNDNDKDSRKKYAFVKTKAVNKSYSVSSADKLNIQNSFGSVKVNTWDRNEIKVDVDIEVSANTEALAQKMIDRISVNDGQRGGEITFKTAIKDVKEGYNSKGEKSNMHINYNISMPANSPLTIKNEFGATTIPDYRGEVDLTSKFGSLTTGNLPHVKSIDVEFGKANFKNITDGSITIKYSKAEFAKLSGKIDLKLEFCSYIVMNLDNSLTGLDVKASYSTVNLKPAAGLSAAYNISTSFGSLKNRTSINFDGDEEGKNNRGPKFDFKYSGKSGNGAAPIKVKMSFGNVIIGEPGPDDMKEKDKSKSKTS